MQRPKEKVRLRICLRPSYSHDQVYRLQEAQYSLRPGAASGMACKPNAKAGRETGAQEASKVGEEKVEGRIRFVGCCQRQVVYSPVGRGLQFASRRLPFDRKASIKSSSSRALAHD